MGAVRARGWVCTWEYWGGCVSKYPHASSNGAVGMPASVYTSSYGMGYGHTVNVRSQAASEYDCTPLIGVAVSIVPVNGFPAPIVPLWALGPQPFSTRATNCAPSAPSRPICAAAAHTELVSE